MTTVAIDANNAIQIIKNNKLISVTNQGTSVFNNNTSLYGVYDMNKLNDINNSVYSSDTVLNGINSQLGDLSAVTNNGTLAVIINNMLTQLTTLNIPLAPTNGISSGAIIFNDIHFTTGKISGALSWTIPGTLTNITHFEAFLSVDQLGTQRDLDSLFTVNNTINSVAINDVYIGSNLYIVIYTKNINSIAISSLQTTAPGYVLINDIYNVDVLSISFIPTDSLFTHISGTISWIFNSGIDSLFDGVNVYYSFNGTTKGALIESQIVKTTTDKIVTNDLFDTTHPYYVQIYTYKVVNSVTYESQIFKTFKIENKYQPTNIVAVSLDFMGDLDSVAGTLTGTLVWGFQLPKESVDGVDIFITDTGSVFGDTDNLIGRTTSHAITSFTFKSLNILIVDPANQPNTVKTLKFIIRTYNQHGNNPVTVAKIVLDV
jgi:hypothetical protein